MSSVVAASRRLPRSTQGSLLENKELIEALNQIKSKSSVVKTSLEESHRLQESLDQQREEYRPFAHQGSLLWPPRPRQVPRWGSRVGVASHRPLS